MAGAFRAVKTLAKASVPALAFVPVVGTAIDVVSAATGRDLLDGGRKMSGAERLLVLGGVALGAVTGGAGAALLKGAAKVVESVDKASAARAAFRAAVDRAEAAGLGKGLLGRVARDERGSISLPGRALRGSGPVPGVLEASPRARSVRAINNWSGRPVEFVFDPGTGTFAMGRPAGWTGLLGSGHQKLAAAIGANRKSVVGGMIRRGPNGGLEWNEWSGHYWRHWNERVRVQFVTSLKHYGVHLE